MMPRGGVDLKMKMFKSLKRTQRLKRIKKLGRRPKRLLWLKRGFLSRHEKKSGWNKVEISFGREFWNISVKPWEVVRELVMD
ncbi:hypothetical protein CTI12_AA310630 [Artemisia annua]|uniref:Uncharacterized protein n=1 Tax=Artemisia annua TaxID=35608 RepID=A0A2U1MZC5_ARTAN|nr:hypothetical protein CTI12_AA310630 [Artemisia annua]